MAASTSPLFSISVVPPGGSGQASWIAWEEHSYAYGSDEGAVGDPNNARDGALGTWFRAAAPLQNFAAWQANVARRADIAQVPRLITPIWGGFFVPVWDEEFPLVAVIPG
jgi:hypothetical protein